MTDLRGRAPARAAMEKFISFRGTKEIVELPLGLVWVRPAAMNWLRGTRGELFMARELAKLGPEWTVLHSVLVGDRGDIDHIAVGPPGVFPINTKRLVDGEVRVNGSEFRNNEWERDYLAKAADENDRFVRLLTRHGVSAPVLPIIAISGAETLKVKGAPHWRDRNIGVVAVKDVVPRLLRRQVRLDESEVARAAEVLSDSTLWSHRTSEVGEDADLLRAFRLIDRGVGRLRNLLILGLALASIGFAWWASSTFIAWALRSAGY